MAFHGFKTKGESQPAPMGAIPAGHGHRVMVWDHRLVGSGWLHNESVLSITSVTGHWDTRRGSHTGKLQPLPSRLPQNLIPRRASDSLSLYPLD